MKIQKVGSYILETAQWKSTWQVPANCKTEPVPPCCLCVASCQYESPTGIKQGSWDSLPTFRCAFIFLSRGTFHTNLLLLICTYWSSLFLSYCEVCILLYLRVLKGAALFTFTVKMCFAHYEHYTNPIQSNPTTTKVNNGGNIPLLTSSLMVMPRKWSNISGSKIGRS